MVNEILENKPKGRKVAPFSVSELPKIELPWKSFMFKNVWDFHPTFRII